VKNALKGKIATIPQVDNTLTKAGFAADAKMVGDRLLKVSPEYAQNVIFDNARSGMSATNSQAAIEELHSRTSRVLNGVTEWINPPMAIGAEYRTTETFMGKPVYLKLLSCGALPSNDVKWVGHGITNMGYIVAYGGTTAHSNFAKVMSVPFYIDPTYYGHLSVTHENVVIATSAGVTASEAAAYSNTIVWVKYTKTTD
jgi:hypothetical protein